MLNPIYVIDETDDRQIDPQTLTILNGVVTSVTDTSEVAYPGNSVVVLTDRDFIWVQDLELPLCEGDEVYLDNQSRDRWTICRGWYEVDGNPAIYGWYLSSIPIGKVRSLYLKDLNNLVFATRKTQFSLPTPIIPDPELIPEVTAVHLTFDNSGNAVLTAVGSNFGSDTVLNWNLMFGTSGGTLSSIGSSLSLDNTWSYILSHESGVRVQVQIGEYLSPIMPITG